MKYTIKAIPTTYRNVQFRSRLEAKWAAMFDLLKWKWEYEPFDCDGWIPDFILGDKILVEVKPIATEGEFREEAKQIEKCLTTDHEILILGCNGPRIVECDDSCIDMITIGFFGEYDYEYEEGPDEEYLTKTLWWEWVAFGRTSQKGSPWDICHSVGSYTRRLIGIHEGGRLLYGPLDEARKLWAIAGNTVQWRGA